MVTFKGHCTFPNEPHQYRINKNHRLAVGYSHNVQNMDSERDEGIGPFSFPPFFFLFFLFLHYFLPVKCKNFISFLIHFLQMYQNVFFHLPMVPSPHSLCFCLFFCHFLVLSFSLLHLYRDYAQSAGLQLQDIVTQTHADTHLRGGVNTKAIYCNQNILLSEAKGRSIVLSKAPSEEHLEEGKDQSEFIGLKDLRQL